MSIYVQEHVTWAGNRIFDDFEVGDSDFDPFKRMSVLDDWFQGNAENSTMIMVGDVLKKTSAVFGEGMWDVEDFPRSMCGYYSFLHHFAH